nr:unnamed protein product [Callosobruchus analis]
MPHAIQQYNNYMGGTDLMDRNISNYRPQLRNNKWWWQFPMHGFYIDADEYTEHPRALDLLGFIRYIVSGYLLLNSQEQRKEGALFVNVPDAVSKNMSVLHHPNSMKQNRCRVCKKNTTFGCGGKMFPYLIEERESKRLSRNTSPKRSLANDDRTGDTISRFGQHAYTPRYQNSRSPVPSPPKSPTSKKPPKIKRESMFDYKSEAAKKVNHIYLALFYRHCNK